jgi:hypothetical protein
MEGIAPPFDSFASLRLGRNPADSRALLLRGGGGGGAALRQGGAKALQLDQKKHTASMPRLSREGRKSLW